MGSQTALTCKSYRVVSKDRRLVMMHRASLTATKHLSSQKTPTRFYSLVDFREVKKSSSELI
jgi:hypothetical protein